MIVDLNQQWRSYDLPCLRRSPEMFFVDHGADAYHNPPAKVQAAWDMAKAVCIDCPALKQCARDNLGELDGVWGGLDPAQRAKLRRTHVANVRALTGPLKREYAKLAYDLRTQQRYSWAKIAQVIGLNDATAQYLHGWWVAYLKKRSEELKVVSIKREEVKESEKVVTPNAAFPAAAPQQGDGWVRYGRRAAWAYYLGETTDGAWFQMRVKVGTEYSTCWLRAYDVKLTRPVTRTHVIRVGNGSRIYGTPLSSGSRSTAQAG